jgi:hypothetical protein
MQMILNASLQDVPASIEDVDFEGYQVSGIGMIAFCFVFVLWFKRAGNPNPSSA